jgi:hypothetical protein
LVEIDRNVSQTDITDGNIQRENQGKPSNVRFTSLVEIMSNKMTKPFLNGARRPQFIILLDRPENILGPQ